MLHARIDAMTTAGGATVPTMRLARWWDADLSYGFRHSPVAIVSALVLAICLAAAPFAPWIAAHNPSALATLNLTDARSNGLSGAIQGAKRAAARHMASTSADTIA